MNENIALICCNCRKVCNGEEGKLYNYFQWVPECDKCKPKKEDAEE